MKSRLFLCFLFFSFPGCINAGTASNLPLYPPTSGYVLNDAFPGLTFDQPVAMATPPGETNRLFVVERGGRIMAITNLANPTKTVFFDLSKDALIGGFDGLEQGLLGLAFHPGFQTNGYFYVYRTRYMTNGVSQLYGLYNVLSRFSIYPDNPDLANANSELQLIAQRDISTHHNAGDLKFGPDGYLYVSLGEAGPTGDDVSVNPQSIQHGLFGGIIRIDVDKRDGNLLPNPHPSSSTNYFIPLDNPFVGTTRYQNTIVDPSKVRTEYYAIGLRNPWRMNFDTLTGKLFVGDVGQDRTEEINEVLPGANYGWPYFEGTNQYLAEAPPGVDFRSAALSYTHGNGTNEGNCVIGGLFYYGQKIPQLYKKYIYADFTKGSIWSADYNGANFVNLQRLTGQTQLTCFTKDPRDSEILAAGFEYGKIFKLQFIEPSEAPKFPQTLSETGIFSDLKTLSPSDGVYPYEVNHPFWSDKALKQRWFLLPESGQKIKYSPLGDWIFPEGTVWVKQFDLETEEGVALSRKRIETRFLVKTSDTAYGVTYRWNEQGTEAFLVPKEGADQIVHIQSGTNSRDQMWHFPGRAECMSCHLKGNGLAAAFNTLQLNCQIERNGSTINQLQWLSNLGAFEDTLSDIPILPRLTDLGETDTPIETRARSYLHANCAICHQPATSKNIWDARIATPFENSTAYFVDNTFAPLNLLKRFAASDGTRMPPLASNLHDTNAYNLLSEWISTRVPPSGWSLSPIGTLPEYGGSAAFHDSNIRMGGYGGGILASGDQLQFLNHLASNDVTVVVQVDLLNTNTLGAGLLLRNSLASDSALAFIGVNEGAKAFTYTRQTDGGSILTNQSTIAGFRWLKSSKSGSGVNLMASMDGSTWTTISSENIDFGDVFSAGVTTWSSSVYKEGYTEFNNYTLRGLRWPGLPPTNLFAGNPITLEVEPIGFTNSYMIEWYSDGNLIGTSNTNFILNWTNALAGTHLIQAVARDSSGLNVYSEPRPLTVAFPKSVIEFSLVKTNLSGNWLRNFGREAIYFPSISNTLPSNISIQMEASQNEIPAESSDSRALIIRNSPTGERILNEFEGSPINFNIDLKDGYFHLLNLYFVDWDNSSSRQQITIKDAETGDILEHFVLTNYSSGVYVGWKIRGSLSISIEGSDGQPATLGGIFLDKINYNPPKVVINKYPFVAGASQPIEFSASVLQSDNPVQRMELFINQQSSLDSFASPWHFANQGLLAGEYDAFVRAYDSYGVFGDSDIVHFTILNTATHARFVGSDTVTGGNWLGRYGADGFVLPRYATNLPISVNCEILNNTSVIWAWTGENEVRALQLPNATGRIASAFYNRVDAQAPFSISANLNDGLQHRLTLYCLDWDRDDWKFTLTLKNETGQILDQRVVSNFADGVYLTWEVAGAVTFEISNVSGFSTIAGIFIDPIPSGPGAPNLLLEAPGLVPEIQLPANILVQASIPNSSVLPNEIRFYLDRNWIGTSRQGSPYSIRLKNLRQGSHLVSAKAVFENASWIDSTPLSINAVPSESQTKAIFLKEDSSTSGNWNGNYGTEGYQMYIVGTNLPSYIQVSLNDPLLYIWDYWGNSQQGLAMAPGIRVAATWYHFPNVDALISFEDSRWHTLSVYCLDWDNQREQRIQILDAATMQLLDERPLANFTQGKYLSWQVQGKVVLRAETDSINAVVSGLFVDPISPLEEWRLVWFANLASGNESLAKDYSDPENDGIPNISEFKFGLNPLEKDVLPSAQAFLQNDQMIITVPVNPDASGTDLDFEISTNLSEWQQVTPTAASITPGQNSDLAHFTIPLSNPQTGNTFIRFGVKKMD